VSVQAQTKKKQSVGKPSSFGDVELRRIIAEIPKDLARRFNVYVAQNDSRLNIELAQAIKEFLERKQIKSQE